MSEALFQVIIGCPLSSASGVASGVAKSAEDYLYNSNWGPDNLVSIPYVVIGLLPIILHAIGT